MNCTLSQMEPIKIKYNVLVISEINDRKISLESSYFTKRDLYKRVKEEFMLKDEFVLYYKPLDNQPKFERCLIGSDDDINEGIYEYNSIGQNLILYCKLRDAKDVIIEPPEIYIERINKLNNELKVKEKETKEHKENLSSKSKEYDSLNKKYKNLEKEISILKSENEKLQEEKRCKKNQVTEEAYFTLSEIVDEGQNKLKKSITFSWDVFNELNKRYNNSIKRIRELEEEIMKLKNEIHVMNVGRMTDEEGKKYCEFIGKENNDLKKEIENLKTENQIYEEQYKTFKKNVEDLTAKNGKYETQLKALLQDRIFYNVANTSCLKNKDFYNEFEKIKRKIDEKFKCTKCSSLFCDHQIESMAEKLNVENNVCQNYDCTKNRDNLWCYELLNKYSSDIWDYFKTHLAENNYHIIINNNMVDKTKEKNIRNGTLNMSEV